jgi:hypothetical protein
MQPRERNIVNTQILHWRTAISSREDKTPLVTILSQNAIDDKISLILVPLLSSLGVGLLKFIWRDEIAGQSLFNNLSVIPGMELPPKHQRAVRSRS